MSRLSQRCLTILTGIFIWASCYCGARSLQYAGPAVQSNLFGVQNSYPSDDDWIEIDDRGVPIEASSTPSLTSVDNKLPGFIQALNNGELGPNTRFQVLQSSDGSVVYLVPGRRPMDRIPTEQDITVNEIFRLFDRVNRHKDLRRPESFRPGEFGPRLPQFRLPPFPSPPPLMPPPFFAPQIPPFGTGMPMFFGPPGQQPPWSPNIPFPHGPHFGQSIPQYPFRFSNIPRPTARLPNRNSSTESRAFNRRPSSTAPVMGGRRPQAASTRTLSTGPKIGKTDQRNSWFENASSIKKQNGSPRRMQFSRRPVTRY